MPVYVAFLQQIILCDQQVLANLKQPDTAWQVQGTDMYLCHTIFV
jgi:hypothetical protein